MSEHNVVVMTEHDIIARVWVTDNLMKIFITVISTDISTDISTKNWVTEISMWLLIEVSAKNLIWISAKNSIKISAKNLIEILTKNLIEISAENLIEISAKNLIERRLYLWRTSLIIVFTSSCVRKFIAWEVNEYEMLSFVWEIISKWKLDVETWLI